MIILVLIGINLFLFILALLWVVVPALYGLPSKPTKHRRIRKALQLIELRPGELLYDLGAGDGRVLFIAAEEFGAKVVGVEIAPVQLMYVWLRKIARGLDNRIRIQWGNFYRADVGEADVVYIYATFKEVIKIAPHLKRIMKKGSRVISISADIPDWEPDFFDEEDLLFGYTMPPKEGSMTTYMLKNLKD